MLFIIGRMVNNMNNENADYLRGFQDGYDQAIEDVRSNLDNLSKKEIPNFVNTSELSDSDTNDMIQDIYKSIYDAC